MKDCIQCGQPFKPRGNRKTCFTCKPASHRVKPPSDGSLRDVGGYWYGSFYHKGRQFQFSTGIKVKTKGSKGKAKLVLQAKRAQAQEGYHLPGDENKVHLGHMVELIRDDYEEQGYKSTATAIIILRHLMAWFANPVAARTKHTTWDDLIQAGQPRAANTIHEDTIRAYRSHRLAKVGKSTINREVAMLHKGLALLHRKKKIATIPEFPKPYAESKPRQGFLELDQVKAICQELPDYLAALCLFAYYSGWRSSEIRGLTWDRVNLDDGIIRLDDSKSGEPRVLKVFPQVREILEQQQAKRHFSKYVFPNPKGNMIGDYHHTWRRAATRAGYPNALLHDNRRATARNLIRAGVSEDVAMKWTGHKTRSIFSRYNITDTSDLDDAAEKLTKYMASKKQTPTKKVEPIKKGSR